MSGIPRPTLLTLTCLLMMLMLHPQCSLAGYERTCTFMSRPHPQGVCGSNLQNMVQNLCRTIRRLSKRSVEDDVEENMRDISLTKKDALSYLSKRETRGTITCECCYHYCTPYELLQYCNLPPSFFTRSSRNIDSNAIGSLK